LPDMTGIEPGWQAPPELRERQSFHDDPSRELRRYLTSTGAESNDAAVLSAKAGER
jgi:cytochrome c-type protein NapC